MKTVSCFSSRARITALALLAAWFARLVLASPFARLVLRPSRLAGEGLGGGNAGLRPDARRSLADTGIEQRLQGRIGRLRVRPTGLGARRPRRILLGALGGIACHRLNMGQRRHVTKPVIPR